MRLFLHGRLDRVGLLWTTQFLHHLFLRRHDGAHLHQRESCVLLPLCGDDWEPVAFDHEIGESFCIGISKSDGVVVLVAVSYEIGGGNALRLVVRGAFTVAVAPSHGLRSEGGVFRRRQRRTLAGHDRMDGQPTPSDTAGGKRGLVAIIWLESDSAVLVSRDAVLSCGGDHRLLRVAKQHGRNPFPYRILLLYGAACFFGGIALSDAESDDDAAKQHVFLSVGGVSQHFLLVRHDS